jgi:hypothetical protein
MTWTIPCDDLDAADRARPSGSNPTGARTPEGAAMNVETLRILTLAARRWPHNRADRAAQRSGIRRAPETSPRAERAA